MLWCVDEMAVGSQETGEAVRGHRGWMVVPAVPSSQGPPLKVSQLCVNEGAGTAP